MASVDLAGVGLWSESFSGWEQFLALASGEAVEADTKLQPQLISPRERRRAPHFVKMAVEAMDQACSMAGVDRASVATVFASGMGDMQITDYMCRTLATMPRTISPTKFHNSVHNAATGYWSIATGSHAPANAISGYDHCSSIALIEAATQVIDEDRPVLVGVQETAAPQPFKSVYDSDRPLSVALLLAPPGSMPSALCTLKLEVTRAEPAQPAHAAPTGVDLSGNFAGELLELLQAVASDNDVRVVLPVSGSARLAVDVINVDAKEASHG